MEKKENKLLIEAMKEINKRTELVFMLNRRSSQAPYFPPTETVPGICDIYDPFTNTQRTIKYATGLSTIFVDEMSDAEKLRNPESIMFTNGVRVVSTMEVNLSTYMMLCAYNEDASNEKTVLAPYESKKRKRNINNSSLFLLRDFHREDSEIVSKREASIRMENKVLEMKDDELRAYYFATMGGRFTIADVSKLELITLKRELLEIARIDAERIERVLTDSAIRARYWLGRAISEGKVLHKHEENALYWPNSQSPFFNAVGSDVITFFAESYTVNPKVRKFVDEIEELMGVKKEEKEVVVVGHEDQFYINLVEEALDQDLVLKFVENGTIRFSKRGVAPMEFKDKEEVIEAIKKPENKKLLASLIIG
jgi:hypothetical protein